MKPPIDKSSKSSRLLALPNLPKGKLSTRQTSDHSIGSSKNKSKAVNTISIATAKSSTHLKISSPAKRRTKGYRSDGSPKELMESRRHLKLSPKSHDVGIPMDYSQEESDANANALANANANTNNATEIDEDPVGTHVTRLLNEGAFRNVLEQRERDREITRSEPWFPILSNANWNRCKNMFHACKRILWPLPSSQSSSSPRDRGMYGNEATTMTTTTTPSSTFSTRILETFFVFCKILCLVVIPAITIVTHIVLIFLIRVYLFLMVTIATLFVNWEDVYNMSPRSVQQVCDRVVKFVRYLDDHILLAGQLKGRERWRDAGRTNLHHSECNSQLHQEMMHKDEKFPHIVIDRVGIGGPSTSSKNGYTYQDIDWNGVHQSIQKGEHEKERGGEENGNGSISSSSPLHPKTVNHLVAMNFVHVMMYNEYQQDQATLKGTKKKNRRNLLHSKKSMRRPDQKSGQKGRDGSSMTMHKGASYIIENAMNDSSRTLRCANISGRADDMSFDEDDVRTIRSTGSGVRTMQSSDAIELIESSPLCKNQKLGSQRHQSSKHRSFLGSDGGLSFCDESLENTASRSRMCSDFDDDLLSYASEEGYSADNTDSIVSGISYSSSFVSANIERQRSKSEELQEKKNKKWLDVGAKIGIRILKSEPVQNAIAQTQNLSVDTIGNLTHDDIETDHENDLQRIPSPTRQIAKPFHTMWSTTEDLNDGQYLDHVSEVCSFSDSDAPSDNLGTPKHRRRRLSLSPAVSRRTLSYSLSPPKKKRWRSFPYNQSHSLPSSPKTPKRIMNSDVHGISSPSEFGTNTSAASSDAIQWVPRDFDANRHLPESMAINQGVISNTPRNSQTIFASKDIRGFKPEAGRNKSHRQRQPLLPGIKIIVPIVSLHDLTKSNRPTNLGRFYQSATVISSKRIRLDSSEKSNTKDTNALSVEVYLDKCFLRNSSFAKMTIRIPDNHRHFLRHSKYPIGTAVATSFGIGVFVGWRPNDDCHIVRSLWQKRGQGSSHAYLNRNALHGIMEASVGFRVMTSLGNGKVVGYVDGGKSFNNGKYLVQIRKQGRAGKEVVLVCRSDILQCKSTKFIPVIEQLKEAAKYQMQKDNYEAERLQLMFEEKTLILDNTWRVFSEGFELFLTSFIKAAEEDENFDSEISTLLSTVIGFLEDFDLGDKSVRRKQQSLTKAKSEQSIKAEETHTQATSDDNSDTGAWLMKSLFGDIVKGPESKKSSCDVDSKASLSISSNEVSTKPFGQQSYVKIYAILKTLMRTVAIAKAGCTNKPNLKMALAIIHETLLFVHNVIKVQQRNMTQASIEAWKKTLDDFADVFGPMNARLQKIGNGILERLQEHGKLAKLRAMRFADLLIADDSLIESLERGDIRDCIHRVENAAVIAKILNEEMREQYHKLCVLLYNTLAPRASQSTEAASRNGRKFTFMAKALKILATPARSALNLLTNDDVLDVIERVIIRVFDKEEEASQIINIYSWNFRTLRFLRIFNNMAIVGNLWAPVLDAADEEFSWAVSRSPQASQQYIGPISKLFSLGVARFHQIHKSDAKVSADWIDFLMEDEAIRIIQELDGALMLFLTNFCYDMKEMMYILPYYSTIDDDILNLIDEVDIDKELKEIGEALTDVEKFPRYVREKSANAVGKFLDYLPKMSIPIERREVGDGSGWVITCRGRNGKDLTLSNVSIERDNLLCDVFGSQNVLGLDEIKLEKQTSRTSIIQDAALAGDEDGNIEVSILDHVAELIRNAQSHGCWDVDATGFEGFSNPRPLDGLPLSEVLHCAVDLWDNLQIDDDELLEIAIREISYQIQIHKGKVEDDVEIADQVWPEESMRIKEMHNECAQRKGLSIDVDICNALSIESNASTGERRFDPSKDSTVLYLGMNQLTCCLDDFTYRLEPAKPKSIFDPIFEGVGSLSIKNASMIIRVECRKERRQKLGEEVSVPVLQLQELEVGMEQVKFQFKETGADWLLNKIIANFTGNITQIVRENLREQISLSINNALETLNHYIEVNPDIMLKILGITIDDLEENIEFVSV